MDESYITVDGQITKRPPLATRRSIPPSFLLGIWHCAAAVCKDNTVGDDTYNRWCPSAGKVPRIYQGNMGEDVEVFGITAKQQPPTCDDDVEAEDDAR